MNFEVNFKGQCHEKSVRTETVGYKLDTINDVLDPNFIVLHCPFNLIRIYKDGAHRSKTVFMLGPSSGVKLTSEPTNLAPNHAIVAPPAVVGGRNVN